MLNRYKSVFSWTKTVRYILLFVALYTILALILFFGLRKHKERFNQQTLSNFTDSISKFRDKTDNPCLYSIFGDPSTAQEKFMKLNLFCDYNAHSLNTMDLRALGGETVRDAIMTLARVSGFSVSFEDSKLGLGVLRDTDAKKWVCYQQRQVIANIDVPIIPKSTVDCFYGWSKQNIDLYYEKL